jgi:hypothetical protein
MFRPIRVDHTNCLQVAIKTHSFIVMDRQFLTIPEASATNERVFSFAGLTLSDLCKSLLEGTLEEIMWSKWGSPSIPLGRGDLHITHHEHIHIH